MHSFIAVKNTKGELLEKNTFQGKKNDLRKIEQLSTSVSSLAFYVSRVLVLTSSVE